MRNSSLLANYLYDISKIIFTSFVVGVLLTQNREMWSFVVIGLYGTVVFATLAFMAESGKAKRKEI